MEPERPIEKLLRAWARRRRQQAGAPLELHPATRRLLHGEIARRFGSQQPRKGFLTGWTRPFWPRLSWALAVLALVGVAAWLAVPRLTQPAKVGLLAKNEPARSPVPSAAPSAPASAPKQPETSTLNLRDPFDNRPFNAPRNTESKDKDLSRSWAAAGHIGSTDGIGDSATLAKSATPPQGPLTVGAGLGGASRKEPAGMTDQKSKALAETQVTTTSGRSTATETLSAAPPAQAETTLDHLAVGQRFAQVHSFQTKSELSDAAPTTPPVLVSFQVEEVGRQLRIIDADGSVYTGTLQPANTAASRSAGTFAFKRSLAQSSAAAPDAPFQPGELGATNWSFAVSGTNRSLQQQVLFTGQFLPGGPLPEAEGTNLNVGGTVSGSIGGADRAKAQPWPNTRISGQATIGGRQVLRIDALPAKTP